MTVETPVPLPPRHSSRRRLLFLLAPFVVVIVGLIGLQLVESRQPHTPISSIPDIATPTPGAAPQIALPRLGGPDAVTLDAWRGKGVVLNFWATWCYPCRIEMPLLADAHVANAGQVEVVGVNEQESAESAQAFVEEFGIPFPILVDAEGTLGDAFGIQGMPTTYFIDATGQVVGMHLGPLDNETLDSWIAKIRP